VLNSSVSEEIDHLDLAGHPNGKNRKLRNSADTKLEVRDIKIDMKISELTLCL